MGAPTTAIAVRIDDVLARMDAVLDRCLRERSRLGYFAALYRDVTVQVKAGIAAGRFDDGQRMERLDVVFATRYLDALEQYWRGESPTRSWKVAFDSAFRWRPVVLQHLLLGMNAHINLDLAIAAAQTCAPTELPSLKRDFDEITVILDGMIRGVQARLERISPWLRIIDTVGGRTDERMMGFAIAEARDLSWKSALRLAACTPEELGEEISLLDEIVALLGDAIRSPGPITASALEIVRLRETQPVDRVIEVLRT